jgi:phage protein D
LLEFSPVLKVLDQYTKVTVKGRHRVRSRPLRVSQEALPRILNDELHRDSSRGAPELVSGPDVRRRYFEKYFNRRFADNPFSIANQTNIDEERAAEMAGAVLRQKARQFMTITGTTIGLPHLRPGVYVEIRDMRAPFDGFYYVEKTVTRYGSGGSTTQFTTRRPGMPLPPYEEE